jgi:hypothetical protein
MTEQMKAVVSGKAAEARDQVKGKTMCVLPAHFPFTFLTRVHVCAGDCVVDIYKK